MDMYLLHEQMAKVKAMDLERELARDSLIREATLLANPRAGVRQRLAAALLTLANLLDPVPAVDGAQAGGSPFYVA